MNAGESSGAFPFLQGSTTIDLMPLAHRAVSLFAPSLRAHEREICTLVARWMESGESRINWPDWAQAISRERRDALACRIMAWVVWLSRREDDHLKMNSKHWAPVTQIEIGAEACAAVHKLAAHLYVANDPPLLPLGGCRKLRCTCTLKTMTHEDFGAGDDQCVVIVKRRKSTHGTIAELVVAPKQIRRNDAEQPECPQKPE